MNEELLHGQGDDGQQHKSSNNNDGELKALSGLSKVEGEQTGSQLEEKRDKSPERPKNDDSPEELYISEPNPSTTTTPSADLDSTTLSESTNDTPFRAQSNSELVDGTKESKSSKQTGDIDDVKQTTEQSNFNANMKSVSMHDMKTKQFNCSVESTTTDSSPADDQSASEASKAASMAFTIDFGDAGAVNTQRHNKMLERFQQRHRRGQSLSKLEEGGPVSVPGAALRSRTPHSAKTQRKKSIGGANTSESSFSSEQEDVRVQVRFRDKTTSSVKDTNKRHSWSPRSSMNEPFVRGAPHQQTYYGSAAMPANGGGRHSTNVVNNSKRFAPRSTTLTKALESVSSGCRSLEVSHSGLDSSIDSSLTMSCSDPPLEDMRPPDEDAVSEAGTYTLDGDNYTEEQKEKMNIDYLEAVAAKKLEPSKAYTPLRPHNLGLATQPTTSASSDEKRRKNILEVSYSHDTPTPKSKQSYLDKIKSRVKHIVSDKKSSSKSPDRMIALAAASAVTPTAQAATTTGVRSPDMGSFTSVTTSGVLSVKGTLEAQHPKIKRKNSLTKSQIDSSEYVQGMSKLNLKHLNGDNHGYTDLEKSKLAEYKLNIFTKPSATSDSCEDEPEEEAGGSVLKTVATKKDWIQEWAKNAREYATKPPLTQAAPASKPSAKKTTVMSRSFDFENAQNNQFGYDFDDPMTKSDYHDPSYEEFGDNLEKHYTVNPKMLADRQRRAHSAMPHQLPSRPRVARVGANEAKLMTSPTRPLREPSEPEFYIAKPPVSPSKIPSPIHTVGRPRSVSHNRSLCGSNTDLSANDTEMYLNETAAAISSLQNIHRRNSLRRSVQNSPSSNSPCSGLMSPGHKQISPTKSSPIHTLHSPTGHDNYHKQLLHKRNLSLDGAEMLPKYGHVSKPPVAGGRSGSVTMTNSLNSDSLSGVLSDLKNKMRPYGGKYAKSPITSPMKCYPPYDQQRLYVDEAELMNSYSDDDQLVVEIAETVGVKSASVGRLAMKQPAATTKVRPAMVVAGNAKLKAATSKVSGGEVKSSPIRRSSSFSTKPASEQAATKQQYSQKPGAKYTTTSSSTNKTPIQKSASSTSFKKMLTNYDNTNYLHKHDQHRQPQSYDDGDDDDEEYYINDDDDLEPDPDYSTDSDFSDLDKEGGGKPPITNTRYNKAFLMRIEQSKKAVVTGSTSNVGVGALTKHGMVACPNTPELRRRDMNARGGGLGMRDRASMPRDSSLNRMKQDISNLNTQRRDKQQLQQQQQQQQQTTVGGKVLPKYLDISKYKSPSAGNFLKRDESKSTLVHRSPSSASVTLNRGDNARTSVRSVKSAGSKPNSAKKDQSAKIKEQELEMWKRRAKYDPMKAAMEGKKKQEEARRSAQLQQDMLSKSCESSSVLRSQSYHSGVGNQGMYPDGYGNVNLRISGVNQRDNVNRWTLTSNESSDFDEEYAIT